MTKKGIPNLRLKGKKQTDDHIKKRIESRRLHGNNIPTQSSKQKCSKTSKGRKPWNTGKKGVFNKKTLELMSLAKLGRKQTPEAIRNAVIGRKNLTKARGYYFTDEVRKRIGDKHRGKIISEEQKIKLKKAWIYEKHVTPQSREKQRISRLNQIFPTKDTKPERMLQIALLLHQIKFEKHKPIIGQPDIFIEPNICVFVDGDYPHANPEKYDKNHIIWKKPKIVTASDIWARDSYINHKLNEMGNHVIRIWTSKIEKDANESAISIIKLIKENSFTYSMVGI